MFYYIIVRQLGLVILLQTSTVFFCETHELQNKQNVQYNLYRILNDPQQVTIEQITAKNLFSWINLKNIVRFKLWTRKNPELAHEIKYNNVESLKTSNFDASRLTKVIIHGYLDTATEVAITYYLVYMRDAYLSLGDVNVIVVDYTLFTIPIFYYTSLPETAGARVAELLEFLVKNTGVKLDSIHLIGFSWGAHVAGLAGHALKGKLGRITGLDPAGPTFHFLENEYRLDKSDAKFVDIIHTNAGKHLFTKGHFGIAESLGHADVYPNGGEKQVGCPKVNAFNYESLECSHGRGVRYFLESITSPLAFPLCRCETWEKFINEKCPCNLNKHFAEDRIYMGEHMSYGINGIFQLNTKPTKPFGQGPQLNVSLPDNMDIDDNEINLRHLRSPTLNRNSTVIDLPEATVIYKNLIMKVKMQNTFTVKHFPNNDVIRLCHMVLGYLKNTSQF